MMNMIGMLNGIEVILILLLGIASVALWICALVDCGRRLGAGERDQLGWMIAIALTHIAGASAYFLFAGRKAKTRPRL